MSDGVPVRLLPDGVSVDIDEMLHAVNAIVNYACCFTGTSANFDGVAGENVRSGRERDVIAKLQTVVVNSGNDNINWCGVRYGITSFRREGEPTKNRRRACQAVERMASAHLLLMQTGGQQWPHDHYNTKRSVRK